MLPFILLFSGAWITKSSPSLRSYASPYFRTMLLENVNLAESWTLRALVAVASPSGDVWIVADSA
jgi:hypothetical protein